MSPLIDKSQPSTPFTVGITGGIGSGKSRIADMFVALGASLIDTDTIAHSLTEPDGLAIPAIRTTFGDGFICPDGRMNRPAMRELVFENNDQRRRLENILHPMILNEVKHQLSQLAAAPYVLISVPLLVESGHWQRRLDRVLVIDCPESLQISRVIQRSNLGEAQVRAIIAAQASRRQRLNAADDLIDNSGSLQDAQRQVSTLHARYVRMSAERRSSAPGESIS
ncbi:MAG: dephospho-CoA kinase [Lautropia sp.]|nr:dephospho-CoA kinase [Lautropia sp.]